MGIRPSVVDRPDVYATGDNADPNYEFFIAKEFAANIYLHANDGFPDSVTREAAYPDWADAAFFPDGTACFDSWIRYPDGTLLLLQMKGQKPGATDSTMSASEIREEFLKKFNHPALRPMLKGIQKGKLFAELCTTRPVTTVARQQIVNEAREKFQMCLRVVAPSPEKLRVPKAGVG